MAGNPKTEKRSPDLGKKEQIEKAHDWVDKLLLTTTRPRKFLGLAVIG